jgi:hypothetical protein
MDTIPHAVSTAPRLRLTSTLGAGHMALRACVVFTAHLERSGTVSVIKRSG